MPIPSKPPFLSNVLGYAADVNTIPATTPSGSGAFSYKSAFPAITAIPLTAGGVAPDREDFNAVFKLLSQHVHFLQSGSLYTWSSSLDYLKGAHILGSNGVEYIAQAWHHGQGLSLRPAAKPGPRHAATGRKQHPFRRPPERPRSHCRPPGAVRRRDLHAPLASAAETPAARPHSEGKGVSHAPLSPNRAAQVVAAPARTF